MQSKKMVKCIRKGGKYFYEDYDMVVTQQT